MEQKIDYTHCLKQLLIDYPLQIVGSTLFKEDPRDLDLILILPDLLFEVMYLSIEEFRKESSSGKWSEKHYQWSTDSIFLSKLLERRLRMIYKKSLSIDLKISSDSLKY